MGFFDKVTVALNSAGKDMAKVAKDVSDASRFSMAISNLEKKNRKLYEKAGELYYQQSVSEQKEQIQQDTENQENKNYKEELQNLCDEITENLKEIERITEELKRVKGIHLCEECGAELKKGQTICHVCGAVMEPEESEEEEIPNGTEEAEGNTENSENSSGIKCEICGTELEGDEIFCPGCGNKVQKPKSVFCKNCGAKMRETAVFCGKCGTPAVPVKMSEAPETEQISTGNKEMTESSSHQVQNQEKKNIENTESEPEEVEEMKE